MANYNNVIVTNEFKVKDVSKFEEIIKRTLSEDIIAFDCRNIDNIIYCSFGCSSYIEGLKVEDSEDYKDSTETIITNDKGEDIEIDVSYDKFLHELSLVVADDDAILIFEVGSEKLRYCVGNCSIVTKNAISFIDLFETSVEEAKKLLDNEDFKTNF